MNAQKLLSYLESINFDFSTASEYGEPGYSTDKPFIIFGNWNNLPRKTLDAVGEIAEIEWSDEWLTDDNNRAFRCQPDSYGWEPSYFMTEDCEIIPWDEMGECEIRENFANDSRRAVPSSFDLSGFASLISDGFETGFHPGQNDKPDTVLEKLLAEDPTGQFVFRISGKGQFDISWEVWKLNPED